MGRTAMMLVGWSLAGTGCGLSTGPSESIVGNWTARSTGHSSSVSMVLEQSGDDISGIACATSDGVLLFRGPIVRGDYPRVRFTVTASDTQPCCAGMASTTFEGKQDGTGDIVGSYGTIDLRFKRSPTTLCAAP